jgi:glycosyltransferase involved in cell wall biosynthesis
MHVTGIEVAGRTTDYDWDRVSETAAFDRTTLFPETRTEEVSVAQLESALHDALTSLAPDVVAVHGWALPSALIATQWTLRTDTPSVLMSESNAHDYERSWWREAIKQRVVSMHQSGLVGGTTHVAYLQSLGMPDDNIFRGYDVVDNAHFADGAEAARRNAEHVRNRLDLPSDYFLASTRFLGRKNLGTLLGAYDRYRKQSSDSWDLVLLGDGPLRTEVEAERDRLGLQEYVHLPGFKQYDDLPAYYGLAGAFVHPSTIEQWGLVVNEAMAAGLPVIVSERCGCAPDLVEDGVNGYTFDPQESDALARRMVRVADSATDRSRMGRASRSIIRDWAPSAFADGLRKATERARSSTTSSYSVLDEALLGALTHIS